MEEGQSKALRIRKLRTERELLKQDILSAAVMDDEGMSGGEEILHAMEVKLQQIDLELKELMAE